MSDTSSNLTKMKHIFFAKPTFALLLLFLVCVSGFISYQRMIKEALPDINIPIAIVNTSWYGTTASVIEKEVTDKIEREIKDLEMLKTYSSGSSFGNSTIQVEFNSNAPMQESLNQLRAKVDEATADLPKNADATKVSKTSIRSMPIATVMLYGNTSEGELDSLAKRLQQKLLRIPGIAKVSLLGNQKSYVRVQLIPERLRSYNISPEKVGELIVQHSSDVSLGVYEGSEMPLNVQSQSAIHNIEQLAKLPLKRFSDDRTIRLEDVAKVEVSLRKAQTQTYYSREGLPFTQGVGISLIKGQGEDTIKLVNKAIKLFEHEKAGNSWVDGVDYNLVSNNAEVIEQELEKTIVDGWQSILAVFVILFFLLTWREATVAALSIPVTFLGTIATLWFFDYTFNVMVVIGMVLALGLLVDDFILMMEGIHDGLHKHNLSFQDSAFRAIKLFAIPSLSGTLTTILIFIPLANIGGIDGKFIQSIPTTAAICLTMSYLVSIFISVPMSRFFMPKRSQFKPATVDIYTEKMEAKIMGWLKQRVTASRTTSYKWIVIGGSIIAVGFLLAVMLPVILYPLSDGRNMGISVELPVDYKLEQTEKISKKIAKHLESKEYLSSVLMVVGQRDFMYEGSAEDKLSVSTSSNVVGYTMLLKPKSERSKLGYEYVPELRTEINQILKDVPGHRVFITTETGASSNEAPLQINLLGNDINALQNISRQVQQKLKSIKGIGNIRDSVGQTKTEATIHPKRELLDFYHISEESFNRQVSSYLGDIKLVKVRTKDVNEDLDVRLETYWWSKKGKQGGPENWDEWKSLSVITEEGKWIPAHMLADVEYNQVPKTISHKRGMRNITVMGDSYSLSSMDMKEIIDPILSEMKEAWPPGFDYRWSGEVELAEETYGNAKIAFLLAILGVFSILVLQFQSFIQPVIILCTVLFGLSGVFYGFMIFGFSISFPAVMGMIALAGINVNDGIVLVDTMNRHLKNGLSKSEAASRGAADRLRPIVSTTLTTVISLVPLAIAEEAWRPLCMAIVFGELLSTLTAIIILPALYNVIPRKVDAL
ncbi:efflux RND transporter permease subunit [Vibrio alginolyticus]